MSWRRYDDGYEDHPKILKLIELAGHEAFYKLGKIHGFSAKFPRNGVVNHREIRALGVRPKQLKAMVETHLLDDLGDDNYAVHDWYIYADIPIREKVKAFLQANPDATANSVVRALGGKRELVLAEVKRFQDEYQGTGSLNGSRGGSKSGSRAPAPVPVSQEPSLLPSYLDDPDAPDAFDLEDVLADMPGRKEGR